MSTRARIIEIAYELLKTKGQLSFFEIEKILEKEGVTFSAKSSAIRSTVYDMAKKDPRIEHAGRGVYQLISEPLRFPVPMEESDEGEKSTEEQKGRQDSRALLSSGGDAVMTYLNDTEKQLQSIAAAIAKMNWLQSSEEQVILAKKRWKRLNDLSKNLTADLQSLEKKTKNS